MELLYIMCLFLCFSRAGDESQSSDLNRMTMESSSTSGHLLQCACLQIYELAPASRQPALSSQQPPDHHV